MNDLDRLSSTVEFVRQDGDVREFRLVANGMRVLLHHRQHSAAHGDGGVPMAPVVTHNVVYRVGSRDESYGTTGYTHALEHALFKGSPLFNKARGTSIWSVLQSTGASMNATTSKMRTHFYATLPAEHLGLAMRVEADRMRGATFTEADLRSEMTTIRNEFERGESSIDNVLYKALWAAAYEAHPVRIPTIGYRSDVEAMTADKLRHFYDRFYWPDNATLIVTGDIVAASGTGTADYATAERAVLDAAAIAYGRVERSPRPFPAVVTVEPRQYGAKVFTVRRAVGTQPIVATAFKSPPVPTTDGKGSDDEDLYALLVLDVIMADGSNSRLYRRFVETGEASAVAASTSQLRDPGLSAAYVHLNVSSDPAVASDDVAQQARLDAALAGIRKEYDLVKNPTNVTAGEVRTAVRKLRTAALFARESSADVMFELNEAVAAGNWRYYTTFMAKIDRVTPSRVGAAARRYAIDDNRTTGFFLPQTATVAANSLAANPLPAAAPMARSPPKPQAGQETAPTAGGAAAVAAATEPQPWTPVLVPMAQGVRFSAGAPGVYTAAMAVRELVSVRGSMPGGGAMAASGSEAVAPSARGHMLADLTALMLDEGTQRRSKQQIAAELERIGASVHFSNDTHRLTVRARMLRNSGGASGNDVDTVMRLVAEQMRSPKFAADAFERVRASLRTSLAAARRSTRTVAAIALARTIYTPTELNYEPRIDELVGALGALTVADVRQFHADSYGTDENFFFVFAGDVATLDAAAVAQRAFAGGDGVWKQRAMITDEDDRVVVAPVRPLAEQANATARIAAATGATTVSSVSVGTGADAASVPLLRIAVADQSSTTLMIGTSVGIDAKHPDYVALSVAVFVLGGNFSARLMQEVRDRRGLTYGIGARLRGTSDGAAGHLEVTGTFAPTLVDEGMRVALAELARWARGDVTEAELADKKRTLIGANTLGAETTGDFAARVADAVEQRSGVEWIDEWPRRVATLTVGTVNAAVRKHVNLATAVVVQAGSVGAAAAAAAL